ncbi:DUF5677 domain-containing protein [Rathayibacter iranicus]|uniref:Uncharacterized protein n=2 Tax=Rathayibacter iranicus TaxID=59737 RepID=A0AAD1ACL5_9MICO|nr:DUF5677 domain-containing protein [Rathayibacter iranicus]AZZ54895.1 hypothetical protein C7V51_02615 [Rathayibacter iranicus]MWV31474.1 hypothetical protein [Rathayibacter iranicus NCPPB 2253 = VKM Ac-1602]PPI62518.1 hypothetical protein C5E08_02635 [Rathayibacter iranicus]PWJ61008.1 hypothetical protein B0H03_12114 [Rathayibacter iranicus NCPPB 2253 = VKM Ac-1602]
MTKYSTSADAQTVIAVRALVAHAVDCGRAIATLYEAKQPLAAVPIIRTLMEDATTTAWLLKTPDGWKGFLREGAETRRKLLENVRAANPDLGADLVREELVRAKELLDQLDEFRSEKDFHQRARSVTGTEDLYVLFRMASGVSHAGAGIVDLYTTQDPTSDSGFSWFDAARYPQSEMWLRVASALLVRALTAWDHVLVGNPLRAGLAPLAKKYGEAPSLTYAPLFRTATE